MRKILSTLAFAAIFTSTVPLFSQGADISVQDDRWMVRVDRSEFDTFNPRMLQSCMVVYGDGRVHIERSAQEVASGSKPESKVYEGKLSEQEVASARTMLDNPDFRKVKALPSSQNIVSHMDESLQAWVMHDDGIQQFIFPDLASRKDYSKTLKPFTDWWRSVEKKKFPQNKTATANRCTPVRSED